MNYDEELKKYKKMKRELYMEILDLVASVLAVVALIVCLFKGEYTFALLILVLVNLNDVKRTLKKGAANDS